MKSATYRFAPTLLVLGLAAALVVGGLWNSGRAAGPATAPATTAPATMASSAPAGQRVFEISEKGLTIDGKVLPVNSTQADLEAVLKKASRTENMANNIVVWDDTGVFAYITIGEKGAHALAIALTPADYKFYPKSCFSGQVKLGSVLLDAKSTPKDLTAAGMTADELMPDTYIKLIGTLKLYASLTADKTHIKFLSLEVPAGQ